MARGGRFELWLGLGCVALLAAAAFGSYYRKDFRALWYRWRFEHGDKEASEGALRKLVELGPAGKRHLHALVVESPGDLTEVRRKGCWVSARNDRGHRLYVGNPSAEPLTIFSHSLALDTRKKVARAVHWLMQNSTAQPPGPTLSEVEEALTWLSRHREPVSVPPNRVLEPGEEATFLLPSDSPNLGPLKFFGAATPAEVPTGQ